MDWIELLLIGFIGLSVGSFLNVSIDRIPSGKSLVHPPSSCDVCKTRLKTFDLIPVGSYLVLKGKCRYCSASIPFRSPLVEFITGAIFVAIWAKFGITYEGIAIMAYASLYLVIFAIDLEHKIIPNVIVFPAFLLTLLVSAFLPGLGIANAAIGAGVGLGMLLALYMVPGAVIGEGDVKLAAVVGAAV
ncbi:MAG: prepilin peptidase [Chloroflexi bacterium]|nr:prepilin peptidase [Chloroflexota bacterium]